MCNRWLQRLSTFLQWAVLPSSACSAVSLGSLLPPRCTHRQEPPGHRGCRAVHLTCYRGHWPENGYLEGKASGRVAVREWCDRCGAHTRAHWSGSPSHPASSEACAAQPPCPLASLQTANSYTITPNLSSPPYCCSRFSTSPVTGRIQGIPFPANLPSLGADFKYRSIDRKLFVQLHSYMAP